MYTRSASVSGVGSTIIPYFTNLIYLVIRTYDCLYRLVGGCRRSNFGLGSIAIPPIKSHVETGPPAYNRRRVVRTMDSGVRVLTPACGTYHGVDSSARESWRICLYCNTLDSTQHHTHTRYNHGCESCHCMISPPIIPDKFSYS